MPKVNDRLILVTGATGHQGGAAFRKLRERGFPVRALARNPENENARALVGHGAEVVRGDLEDPGSLTRAMDGVHGVFSVQPSSRGAEVEIREGITLADAAKRSRISHFVYSSVGSADRRTGVPHFDSKFRIEEHIRGTGMRYTIFRPVFFMENWLGLRDRIEQGQLPLPLAPETRLQMIAVDDIGAFVAMAFEKAGHWQGRAVDIAGDELSMADLAGRFSHMIGREVRYQQVPWKEWETQVGSEMSKMWHWFEDVGYNVDISALRQEHSSLMGFDRWLSTHWVRRQTA
ncbi:MAG TPA: NmrA/HSCARG family protein [Bryobacteraceae bacterium]|nr:NmrA/HSCARG family protein [Bryobacteraceae bacterium]